VTPKKDPADQLPTADWAQAAAPAATGESQSPTASRLPSDEQPTLPQPPRTGIARDAGGDGRYVLVDEIASGAMGVVYLAEDRVVGRRVALKMIRAGVFAGAAEVERFTREARALARLSHPHVVQVYDFGESEGRPFFTMQLASGGTLAVHLLRFRADARVAVALVEKVARGVQHAHEQGILHRDLKPANVLLGAGDEPLVSDFGLVKFLHAEEQGLTQAGVMPGTAPYMAPEQAAGRSEEVGPRTDVWALGVILYELVVGRRPFDGKTREEILHRILTTPVPPPRSVRPGIDAGLEVVVMKCLEKEAGRRYASAGALAEDLDQWLRGGLQRPAAAQVVRVNDTVRRRRLGVAGGVVVVAALTLAGVFFLLRPGGNGAVATSGPELAQPITLIGEDDFRGEHQWLLGEKGAKLESGAEGVSFTTKELSAVQLLAAPPWESYILQAKIRHDAGMKGMPGVFFGYKGYASGRGPCHLLCCAGFADRGNFAGQLIVDLYRIPDDHATKPRGRNCFRDPFKGEPMIGDEAPWRTLTVRVTPRGIKASCSGPIVCDLVADDLRKCIASAFYDSPNLHWESMPSGGIGIYLDEECTASFKDVVVKPLQDGQ